MADLGDRVIEVERPDTGDFARNYDETVRGQSSYFIWLNRSKESIALAGSSLTRTSLSKILHLVPANGSD